jgi:formate dehydrogenase subunit delta
MSHDDKLIYMANQIGRFFASQGEARAVDGIATHLKKFWTPRMRADIVARARANAAGLDPLTQRAVQKLAAEATATVPAGAAAP